MPPEEDNQIKTPSPTAMEETTKSKVTIVQKLLDGAPPLTQRVLERYSVGASLYDNLTKFSRFDKYHLEECAGYLGLEVRVNGEKMYKNLLNVAHRCVLKIESLFPKTCTECKDSYQVELGSTPPLTCWLCSQGSHDCDAMQSFAKAYEALPPGTLPPGMKWLCPVCLEKSDLDLNSKVPILNVLKQDPNALAKAIKHTGSDGDENNKEEEIEQKGNKGPDEVIADKSTVPCKHLANGRCRHGMSGKKEVDGKTCLFLHRKICRRFKTNGLHPKHGCKMGKNCTKLHPKICEGSRRKLKERICLVKDCPHLHLRGTKRKQPEVKIEGTKISSAQQSLKPKTKLRGPNEEGDLFLTNTPMRPPSQQKPEQLQTGFLTQLLKEVRQTREESLKQADRMAIHRWTSSSASFRAHRHHKGARYLHQASRYRFNRTYRTA